MITIPCALIFSTPMLLTYNEIQKGSSPWWMFFLAFITGVAVSWVYWGYMITVWRLWAYKSVKSIKNLKRKAINEFLIWPDKHWLVSAEFRTDKQRVKLRQADRVLLAQENMVLHNPPKPKPAKLPESLSYSYNKKLNLFEVVFCILLLVVGIIMILVGYVYLGSIFTFFGIMGSIYEMRQLKDNKSMIVVNEKGIDSPETGFISWKLISQASVIQLKRGRRENFYLKIDHTHPLNPQIATQDLLELTEYHVNLDALTMLLEHYQS